MISRIPNSIFEWRYVVNNGRSQIKKSCDNCFEKRQLIEMSNRLLVCEECSKDIEMLTNRLPPTEERK